MEIIFQFFCDFWPSPDWGSSILASRFKGLFKFIRINGAKYRRVSGPLFSRGLKILKTGKLILAKDQFRGSFVYFSQFGQTVLL